MGVSSAARNTESPLKKKDQDVAVLFFDYETLVPDRRPSDDIVPIYTELELTQQGTPSNNATYANVQPAGKTVDMDISVIYVDPHDI